MLFMAEFLADTGIMSINSGKNISIITPDANAYGQLVFMDSTLRMIKHMQVLVLAASVTNPDRPLQGQLGPFLITAER